MRFLLIRHGQSTNNLLWEQTGAVDGREPDAPLTDLGHEQARLLAKSLAGGVLPHAIDGLHCSLMTRAVQTAAPIADALDLPLQAHAEIFEVGGLFTEEEEVKTPFSGSTREALTEVSGRLVWPDGVVEAGWHTAEVVEEVEAAEDRARSVVEWLRETYADEDTVALVTHGYFIQLLLRAFLGIDGISGWFEIHNTSVTLIEDVTSSDMGTMVTVRKLDWTPHLSPEQLSE